MLDILLIYPPIYFDKKGEAKYLDVEHAPLGILYLASALREKGYKVDVVDVGVENLSLTQLITRVREQNPRVVGISSMTANLRGTFQVAEAIRKNFPKVLIGLGGSHVSADPDFVKRFGDIFDFGVTGEAETTLPKVVRAVIARKKIKRLYTGEPVLEIDRIPDPARDLVGHLPYKKGAMIFSSRGCPYQCIFCSRPAIGRELRFRSPELVVDEIEKIYQSGEDFFIFVDDTLTLNKKHIIGICEEIIIRDLKISWTGITRVDQIDEEIVKKLKESGCVELTFGVESGSKRIRNEVIKKNLSDRDIKEAFKLCDKHGIRINVFLMIGFPTEKRRDIKKTINFYKGLNLNVIGVHLTIPLPGSEIFRIALKEGKIDYDVIDKYAKGELGEGFHGVWPYYVPNGFTLGELEEYRKKVYLKFYFRPNYILKRLRQDLSSWEQVKLDVKTAISLLVKGDTSRQ